MAGCFAYDFIEKNNASETDHPRVNITLFLVGFAAVAIGILFSFALPINKNLWTPSYVLLTSGLATIVLVLLKMIEERHKTGRWSLPFRWLGTNSLFAYIASSAAGKILATLPVSFSGMPGTIKSLIVSTLFAPWLSPPAASFAYAFFFLVVWIAVCGILYRKGVVVKL